MNTKLLASLSVLTVMTLNVRSAFCASTPSLHNGAEKDVSAYDKRMAVTAIHDGWEKYDWYDGTNLWLEGKAFSDTQLPYDRLPSIAQKTIGEGAWAMSRCSAGMSIRFRTDAKGFRVRWHVCNKQLDGDNISKTGKSGIDVYRYCPGNNRYLKTGLATSQDGTVDVPVWSSGMEDYIVNLPTYNPIDRIEVGFLKGAKVEPPRRRKSGVVNPVVFYGTSITQGGCVSRPGLGYVVQIGSMLDVPVVNLGFSGNGNMGGDVGDYLAKIEASCYVIDTLWNMNSEMVTQRYERFVSALMAKRPGVPIILVGQCNVFNRKPDSKDEIVKRIALKLGLTFVPAADLYPDDSEGTVDGVHPNDYGMTRIAHGIGSAVREALKLK